MNTKNFVETISWMLSSFRSEMADLREQMENNSIRLDELGERIPILISEAMEKVGGLPEAAQVKPDEARVIQEREAGEWDEVAGRVSSQSFRPYVLNNDIGQKFRELTAGLDEVSKRRAEEYFIRILNSPDISTAQYWKVQKRYWDSLSSAEYRKQSLLFIESLPDIKREFVLGSGEECYSEDVFWYHHGLKLMPETVRGHLRGKDVIDGGAFVGDSALMLIKKYSPKKVWSFELSPRTVEHYIQNMKINSIDDSRYHIFPYGLSDAPGSILINDTADQGTSILSSGSFEAQVTDLDSIVDQHDMQVGYIKCDVEGAGGRALEGMKKTLQVHRPIVSLAIYHTPEEYFELKPRFEEIVDDYKLSIAQLNSPWNNFEIFLLGHPKELDKNME